jgi:DUF1009 family protein
LVVAEALAGQGYGVCCLGIQGHADPALQAHCHVYQTIGIARLGKAIRIFQRHGVREATMAGKIHKLLLFRRNYWWTHRPDLEFVRNFYPHFITLSRDRKDDTMLGSFVEAFYRRGIRMLAATDLVPQLLAQDGQLSGQPLTRSQLKDVHFGWQLASEMGRLDVGQSVAVKGRAVLAVEAVEGTDECIRRAGRLCPAGGFSVIKVAKPQQDMRFDVPTVGVGTLRSMVEAGAAVLAIEAQKTILIDRSEFAAFAQQHGIAVVCLQRKSVEPLANEHSQAGATTDSQ